MKSDVWLLLLLVYQVKKQSNWIQPYTFSDNRTQTHKVPTNLLPTNQVKLSYYTEFSKDRSLWLRTSEFEYEMRREESRMHEVQTGQAITESERRRGSSLLFFFLGDLLP